MATPRSGLLRGVNFQIQYLCEYEAKIENINTLVCGPQDVLLGVKKLKKIRFAGLSIEDCAMPHFALPRPSEPRRTPYAARRARHMLHPNEP